MSALSSLIAFPSNSSSKKHYRSREEIYALILEKARDTAYCSYTDMAYASRLPYGYSRQFINVLVDTNLIVSSKKQNYHITNKGTRYLALWYEMRKSLSLPDTLD